MSAMSHEGEEAVRGEFVFTCGYLGMSPRLCFKTQEERKTTSSIIGRPYGKKQKNNLLPSQLVMWEL